MYDANTSIMGPSLCSPGVFYTMAQRNGSTRLPEVKQYLETVYTIAPKIGMRAELVVAQSVHETSDATTGAPWSSFWWTNRLNPAGAGVTGDPTQDAKSPTFASGEAAAKYQLAHLYLYAKGTTLPAELKPSDDPRWQDAVNEGYAGKAPTLAGLNQRWAMDPEGYAQKIARKLNELQARYQAYWGPYFTIPEKEQPVATTFAPAAVLSYLKDAKKDKELVVRNGGNIFFYVDADIVAIRTTPRYQKAANGAAKIGADLNAGDTAHADFAWIEKDGSLWFYSNWDTRFRGVDFRPAGAPIVLPDPEPTPTPDKPVDPTAITAKTYRHVSDPSTLLPPITWRGTTNFFPNRNGLTPVTIVYHCTDDLVFDNTDSWFQNGSSNASSHFVINRDGKVYQYVSSKDGAWTNGDYNNPRTDLSWLNKAISSGANVNNFTISYEFVATPSTPPTEAQYVSAIALSRYFCHPKVYGINPNRSNQCRHADINSVSRSYCPGPNFDLERIIKALDGDPAKVS